jgi:outer membrane lipoprotein-sorting protein
MAKSLIFYFLLIISFSGSGQIKNSDDLIDAMLKRYTGKKCRTLTFSQNTYRPNDSLNKQTIWYEAIEYPDKFRIDFNGTSHGNAAIFRNDSTFRFRNGKLIDQRTDKNDLLLILGGMFFRKKEDVLQRLKSLNYDLGRFSENTWNKRPVYVIGASKNDSLINQIWVDRSDLEVVRILSQLSPGEELDIHVQSPMLACGGLLETRYSFYINGKLDQIEEYKEIQSNIQIDPRVFDPQQFGKVHWNKSLPPFKGNNH